MSVLSQTVSPDGVATLTMTRPESLNALSNELFEALQQAFNELNDRPDVGVIVLTGSGRAFSSGGDVNEMPGDSQELPFETRVASLQRRARVSQVIEESAKLTVAKVNGVAYGAGLALALACDFRIACRSARFITGFINMGFSGDCGAIYLLANLIGAAKAKELFFLSDPIDAEAAHCMGMVTRCVEDASLDAEAAAFAQRLAAGPRVAQKYMKMNFRNARQPFQDALAAECVHLIRTAFTADHAEAKRAFREKRPPRFQGK